MNLTGGACGPAPEPGSRPPGVGTLPLHLVERAMARALECLEEAGVTLAHHAEELPTTQVEQAMLEARAGALAEELRTAWDAVAKVVGRVEQDMRERGRVVGGSGAACHGGMDETAVSRNMCVSPGGDDGIAGSNDEEPLWSRRALVDVMRPWPGMAAWWTRQGAGGQTEPSNGRYATARLRAYGFGFSLLPDTPER